MKHEHATPLGRLSAGRSGHALRRRVGGKCAWRVQATSEQVALLAALYFALLSNDAFWRAALAGRDWASVRAWAFAFGTFALVAGLHFVLLCAVLERRMAKPLLGALLLAAAAATFYMRQYAVFLDDEMLRAVLHTEPKEARELLTPRLLAHMAVFAVLPIAVLWRVEMRPRPFVRALVTRSAWLVAGVLVTAGGALVAYQDLSALMRNHKEVRYLVTPANILVGALRALFEDAARARGPRIVVGDDAHIAQRPAGARHRLSVIIVGETARAANWGLNGYARQTTPELASLGVVNFAQVAACGTSTEVSVPCMFSMTGRRDYDATRIEREESVLHVLDHAGIATLWRDNQTGCKHVCDGLPFERMDAAGSRRLCRGDTCWDEVLLEGLAEEISTHAGTDLVVVLHPLGNHGPSYSARYPARFRVFTPTCDTPELGECSREQVVNSYDNALRYTDHFVAAAIRMLQRQTSHAASLLYVADHGESLGEHGLFLHGIPYAIAPPEQTHVPMVAWFSEDLRRDLGLDADCIAARAGKPATHDNLAHTALGLMGVATRVYEPQLDLFEACRSRHSSERPRRAAPVGHA